MDAVTLPQHLSLDVHSAVSCQRENTFPVTESSPTLLFGIWPNIMLGRGGGDQGSGEFKLSSILPR